MKELRLALDWSEKMWPPDGSSVDQDRQGRGANASALEKEIGPEQFPVNEHYFGLVNAMCLWVVLLAQEGKEARIRTQTTL
ncbi:UNVERIFIED_CONTAM: hypothetical protein K2H54_049336 [Gekko kuhli]